MHRLHTRLLSAGAGLALLVTPMAASAEMATYDGQTLASQPAGTQDAFRAVWGTGAMDQWAMEHNAQLMAAGYVPGQMSMEQSGAQLAPPAMNEGGRTDDQASQLGTMKEDDEDAQDPR